MRYKHELACGHHFVTSTQLDVAPCGVCECLVDVVSVVKNRAGKDWPR